MADTALPRSFDHQDLTNIPEYWTARAAIAALGRVLDDMADPLPPDRDRFVDVCTDMARTSYAGDYCECCMDGCCTRPPCLPVAAHVAQGWMNGIYKCPHTGRTWHCGYAATG